MSTHEFIGARRESNLSMAQRRIVAWEIKKEFRLQKSALSKRRAGKRLSSIERRRIARPRKQIVRIGFEKARDIDPDIPEFDK